MTDQDYMHMALELARKGGRAVAPNPMVGAVIVKNGRVIGQGYHRFFGGPHAEIEAIRSGADVDPRLLQGSTLYVTLEPCSRYGKTPPCTDAIIAAGITRVVAGSHDPMEKKLQIITAFCGTPPRAVANYKLQTTNKLQKKLQYQLEFLQGPVGEECNKLNRFFFKWVKTQLPYITVKVALSADGFVAHSDGSPVKLTTRAQDLTVHKMRALHQTILVSSRTVINDNPHLGVRFGLGQDPLRIILDAHLRIPPTAQVYRDANVLLVCLGTHSIKAIKPYADLGIPVWCAPGRKVIALKSLFKYLGRCGIASVLVEPGPTLYLALRHLNLIDETSIFRSKKCLGKGLPFP